MKVVESIKKFFSHFKHKQLLPSVIIRSGLPMVYRPLPLYEKPKTFFQKVIGNIKRLIGK